MPMLPAHYFTLEDCLTDRAGDLTAKYHLVEDGEAFDVPQPPQSMAAPLAGSRSAVTFNGQNGFVCITDAPATRALSFWVCPESIEGAQVFLSRGASLKDNSTGLSIGHRDGRLRITFGAEVWRAADRHFESGAWTHVAIVFTGELPEIFINGDALMSSQVVRPRNTSVDMELLANGTGSVLLAAEPAGTGAPLSATEAAAFGLRRFFDGSLDGLGLWNWDAAAEGLTAAAIRRLASGGPPDLGNTVQPAAAAAPLELVTTAEPADSQNTPIPEPVQKIQPSEPISIVEDQPAPASPMRDMTATRPDISLPDEPSDEIWNELKELVTSINDDEPGLAEEELQADTDLELELELPVPDLRTSVDLAHCEIAESGAASAIAEYIAQTDSIGPKLPETIAEEAVEAMHGDSETDETDVDIEANEDAAGLLSTLAELERAPEPEPENAAAEVTDMDPAPPLLLSPPADVEPTDLENDDDEGLTGSNAEISSALSEECAVVADNADDTPDMSDEYGLDVAITPPPRLVPDLPPEPTAQAEPVDERPKSVKRPADEQADERQRLRDALTGKSDGKSGRGRFRMFRPNSKRDTSLPDLRGIRPHFGSKPSAPPAPAKTKRPQPAFSYDISGAFADSAVDFGSPIRVKLVPDHVAESEPPKKPAPVTTPMSHRPARARAGTAPVALDELFEDQADELLFR